MIKRTLFAIMLLSFTISASSQVLISLLFGDKLNQPGVEFGIDGGFNWSANSGFENNDYLRSFNLGMYFDLTIKNQWSVYTGVMIKSSLGSANLSTPDLNFLGAKIYPEDGEYSQVIKDFTVPILLKYTLKNHIYFELGPQSSLIYNTFVEFNYHDDLKDINIKQTNTDFFKRIDTGFRVGLGYTLMQGKGITLGANFYQGYINVIKGNNDSKNNAFFIKMNIPIGAAKKE